MERKKRSRASGETLTVPWFVYIPKEIVMPRNPFARPLLLAAFLILVSLRVSAAVPESQTAKISTFGNRGRGQGRRLAQGCRPATQSQSQRRGPLRGPALSRQRRRGLRLQVFRDWTPITFLKELQDSKIPVYLLDGWNDRYVRDEAILFNNLDNPRRITIGPWTHTQSDRLDFGAEHLRWWDYWLKGIDNGIMKEDPVHYFVIGAPEATAWRSAKAWPLPNERRTKYWLGAKTL